MNFKLKSFKAVSCLIILGLSLSTKARAENPLTILRDYGIPCAISIGASAALIKSDGLIIGSTICASLSVATALNKKTVDPKELKLVVEESLSEREAELGKKLEDSILEKAKKIEEEQEKRNEDLRKVIREILADRLIKMEDDLRASVQKMIDNGTFLSELEKRINVKIKEEVSSESRVKQKELIEKVADEVIRQVVAKPIAVPEGNQ